MLAITPNHMMTSTCGLPLVRAEPHHIMLFYLLIYALERHFNIDTINLLPFAIIIWPAFAWHKGTLEKK